MSSATGCPATTALPRPRAAPAAVPGPGRPRCAAAWQSRQGDRHAAAACIDPPIQGAACSLAATSGASPASTSGATSGCALQRAEVATPRPLHNIGASASEPTPSIGERLGSCKAYYGPPSYPQVEKIGAAP